MEQYENTPLSVRDSLLERRTIRRYQRLPIPEEDLRFIREAIRNTPTSYNGQQYSVIEIDDQPLKERLASLVGQKQFKTSARVFCFLSDYHKIGVAAEAKGLDNPHFENSLDGLIVGTVDASLAMMSAIVAATSRGLATCPIGYARTVDPARISEILKLPRGVYLVCALAVGVPAEMPDKHPKQPLDLLFFRNAYGVPDMAGRLLDYDRAVIDYNATRTPATTNRPAPDEINDWVSHILDYYREAIAKPLLPALRARGYNPDR
ncbi:MAG: nitroreductase family protein [Bacteroidales bacterium]|nr:nitroreductase family protein [Bacteroidales bacterium]